MRHTGVGMAMGAGTDFAIESSDAIIVGDRLYAVLAAGEISRRSYRRTQHNVALAFVFNVVGVRAAGTGLVMPIWAMAVMVASVTAVYLNSCHGSLRASLGHGRDRTPPGRRRASTGRPAMSP